MTPFPNVNAVNELLIPASFLDSSNEWLLIDAVALSILIRKLFFNTKHQTAMKHSMYMLTMILLLGLTTAAYSQKAKKPDTFKTLKTIINGSWCQADYVLDLNNTKSPVRSQNKLWQIVLMNINTKSIKNNKLTVDAQSVHEGGSFNIDFKKKAIAANAVVLFAESNWDTLRQ